MTEKEFIEVINEMKVSEANIRLVLLFGSIFFAAVVLVLLTLIYTI